MKLLAWFWKLQSRRNDDNFVKVLSYNLLYMSYYYSSFFEIQNLADLQNELWWAGRLQFTYFSVITWIKCVLIQIQPHFSLSSHHSWIGRSARFWISKKIIVLNMNNWLFNSNFHWSQCWLVVQLSIASHTTNFFLENLPFYLYYSWTLIIILIENGWHSFSFLLVSQNNSADVPRPKTN